MKFAKNHSIGLRRFFHFVWVFVGLFLIGIARQETAVPVLASPLQQSAGLAQLVAQAQDSGTVRVLVQLDLPFRPEGDLANAQAVQTQQLGIDGLQASVLDGLADTNTAVIATYKYIPYLALELDASALETLASLPQVVAIEEDIPVPPSLSSSIPVIGADQAWASGYTGAGQTVAILDTGVDTDHAAFTTGGSRIVAEGCYSTTNAGYASTSVCPSGLPASTAVGSGVDCTAAAGPSNTKAQSDCSHGTHVASIAAGDNGSNIVGVAPDANIIAVQIFSLFNSTSYCAGYSNCMLTFTSDQISGLERVYELRNTYNIASVNMSLGGGRYYAACDSDSRKAAIDNLRAVGIATVIASGNNSYRDSMSAPGCISSAISVGATDNADKVASFSNVAPFIDLMAPGDNIYAAVPNGYGTKSGTSMATPHVTGAWAVYKQAFPGVSVEDALSAFQTKAVLVDDGRTSGVETDLPRIDVNKAIGGLPITLTASKNFLLANETIQITFETTNVSDQLVGQVMLAANVPDSLVIQNDLLSDDATVADGTVTWATGRSLKADESLSRTATFTVKANAAPGLVIFNATADSPDIEISRRGIATLTINEVVSCGFSDGFESGVLSAAWETAVTNEGRIRVMSDLPHAGSYSVVLDDSVAGSLISQAALILTADLTGQAEAVLDFSWYDLGDEYDAAFDGVFVRSNPNDSWVKAYDFAGSYHDAFQNGQVDLEAIAAANGLSLTERFQIKFGFSDNYSFSPSSPSTGDGYALDDISLTCVPEGVSVVQLVDNQNPLPGDTINFQLVVTNNAEVAATNTIINFLMADGLLLNGEVVVDLGTAVSGSFGSVPPLVATGLTIQPDQQIIITIPALISENLPLGTVLENVISVSSNEFGSPPPTKQSIVVQTTSYQVFVPLVIR